MEEMVVATEQIEFIECGSLSISYDAAGSASISLSVVRNDGNSLQGNYHNRSWGGVSFDTVVMNANQSALIGSGGWHRWSLQMQGVGN